MAAQHSAVAANRANIRIWTPSWTTIFPNALHSAVQCRHTTIARLWNAKIWHKSKPIKCAFTHKVITSAITWNRFTLEMCEVKCENGLCEWTLARARTTGRVYASVCFVWCVSTCAVHTLFYSSSSDIFHFAQCEANAIPLCRIATNTTATSLPCDRKMHCILYVLRVLFNCFDHNVNTNNVRHRWRWWRHNFLSVCWRWQRCCAGGVSTEELVCIDLRLKWNYDWIFHFKSCSFLFGWFFRIFHYNSDSSLFSCSLSWMSARSLWDYFNLMNTSM